MQHRHKQPHKLFIVCRHSLKLLDTIGKSFKQIGVFVNMGIVFSFNNAVFPTGKDRLSVLRCNAYDKGVRALSHISHNCQGTKSIDQGWGLRYVQSFTASHKQTDEISQSIHSGMNFCRQSVTRGTDVVQTFCFGAPAACWWARTMALTMKRICKSGSSDTASANRAQIPFSHLRVNRMYPMYQLPKFFGRSRLGEPVRAIQSTASRNSPLFLTVTPLPCCFPVQNDSNRPHWSSRNRNQSLLSTSLRNRIDRP